MSGKLQLKGAKHTIWDEIIIEITKLWDDIITQPINDMDSNILISLI